GLHLLDQDLVGPAAADDQVDQLRPARARVHALELVRVELDGGRRGALAVHDGRQPALTAKSPRGLAGRLSLSGVELHISRFLTCGEAVPWIRDAPPNLARRAGASAPDPESRRAGGTAASFAGALPGAGA